MQDFNPKVQEAVHRIQPRAMTEQAINWLRSEGFTSLNLDLIYGLPYQTSEDLRRTVEQCVEMKPDRVALFGYAHVPWVASNQKMIPTEALPDAPARFAQRGAVAEVLTGHGYEPTGLDHFAHPDDPLAIAARNGHMRRNFQGYTIDQADALLPFGVSSIGRLPQGFVGKHFPFDLEAFFGLRAQATVFIADQQARP